MLSGYFVGLTVGKSPASHSIWAWGSSCLHGATSTVELQLENSCSQTHKHTHIRPNKLAKSHIYSTAERVSSRVYHILVIGGTELTQVFVFSFGTCGLPHIKSHLEPETCDHLQGDRQDKYASVS